MELCSSTSRLQKFTAVMCSCSHSDCSILQDETLRFRDMLIRAVRTNNSKGKQVMPHEKTDTRDESEVQVPVAPEETDSGDESEVPEYLTRQLNSLFPKVICLWFCNASFKSGARGDEALRRAIATRPLDRTIDLSVTHKYVSVLGSVIRECNTLNRGAPRFGGLKTMVRSSWRAAAAG